MALPLLFLAGATVIRAATPAIARYLAKQGLKRATGAAAKKPVATVIKTVKEAKKLKPLRADPKKAPDAVKSRVAKQKAAKQKAAAAKKKKPSVFVTPGKKKVATAGLTVATLATMIPKKDEKGKATANSAGPMKISATTKKEVKAKPNKKSTPIQENLGSGKSKSFKDYKSVAAAQKDNSNFFIGRDGKKKLAVTEEQLTKSGLSLNAMANKVRGGSSIKQLIASEKEKRDKKNMGGLANKKLSYGGKKSRDYRGS